MVTSCFGFGYCFLYLFKSVLLLFFLAEWYAFIGRRAGLNVPGSPYAITFKSNSSDSSAMKPMNVSTYSCGDTSLGCSCGDCPSPSVCSNTAPPSPHKKGSCSIKIGHLKVRVNITQHLKNI